MTDAEYIAILEKWVRDHLGPGNYEWFHYDYLLNADDEEIEAYERATGKPRFNNEDKE